MNVTGKIPVPFKANCGNLSCLIHCANGIQGIDQYTSELCFTEKENEISKVRLIRPYDRITYCPQTNGYFAICSKNQHCIFILDAHCREIDCLKLRPEEIGYPMKDIWFDSKSELIWIVTDIRIYILNSNGDLLNSFMTAPLGTEYKAMCTYDDFVFVGFVKEACLYLASYTSKGVYLEQVGLGGGYTVRNIQPVFDKGSIYLHILVMKGNRFPSILEIELSDRRKSCTEPDSRQFGNIQVEYSCESPEIHSTCNIEEVDFSNINQQNNII